jgi:hypothetical protein
MVSFLIHNVPLVLVSMSLCKIFYTHRELLIMSISTALTTKKNLFLSSVAIFKACRYRACSKFNKITGVTRETWRSQYDVNSRALRDATPYSTVSSYQSFWWKGKRKGKWGSKPCALIKVAGNRDVARGGRAVRSPRATDCTGWRNWQKKMKNLTA